VLLSAKTKYPFNFMNIQIQTKICPAASLSQTEVQKLVTLVNKAYAKHSWMFPNPRTSLEGFLPEIGEAEVILLQAPTESESELEIVGTAYVHLYEGAFYFGMAAIDPTWQGQGLGSRLLQTIEALAQQRHLNRIQLIAVTAIGNEAYYLKRGYTTIEVWECPAGTWDSPTAYRLVKMEKLV
jgi:N-acetylglutamate synthase-like GNAT family acetyltransferase